MSKTLYLAHQYGFSPQQYRSLIPEIVRILTEMGAEVWEPFARNNQVDFSRRGWAYKIGQADLKDVREADGLLVIANGCPPDEGAMVELGIAIGLGKPVFLFRDDFRRCADSDEYPLNLMLFVSLPFDYEDYYYTSLRELKAPHKALAKWLGGTKDAPTD